jgi:hypothetical protein
MGAEVPRRFGQLATINGVDRQIYLRLFQHNNHQHSLQPPQKANQASSHFWICWLMTLQRGPSALDDDRRKRFTGRVGSTASWRGDQ